MFVSCDYLTDFERKTVLRIFPNSNFAKQTMTDKSRETTKC